MDLHLQIDDDLAGVIDIEIHVDPGTPTYLDYRRVSYEEIGGEATNVTRDRSRHPVEHETIAELQRLLPSGPLTTPSSPPRGHDGTTFTLPIGRGAQAVDYTWWSCPPPEWTRLRDIARLLVAIAGVDAYVDLRPDPPPPG